MARKQRLLKNEGERIIQISVGFKKKHVEWLKKNPQFDINTFTREHLDWYIDNTEGSVIRHSATTYSPGLQTR